MICALPAGTPLSRKRPSSPEAVPRRVPRSTTEADPIGVAVVTSTTRPCRVPSEST